MQSPEPSEQTWKGAESAGGCRKQHHACLFRGSEGREIAGTQEGRLPGSGACTEAKERRGARKGRARDIQSE